LGLSASKPLEEQYLKTKEELVADIQISLASKAAERLFLNTETTGMGGDLPAATRVAAYYLGMCGMGGSLYAPMAFGQWQPDGELKHQIEVLLDEQYKARPPARAMATLAATAIHRATASAARTRHQVRPTGTATTPGQRSVEPRGTSPVGAS
jgi:hypothetical protein